MIEVTTNSPVTTVVWGGATGAGASSCPQAAQNFAEGSFAAPQCEQIITARSVWARGLSLFLRVFPFVIDFRLGRIAQLVDIALQPIARHLPGDLVSQLVEAL